MSQEIAAIGDSGWSSRRAAFRYLIEHAAVLALIYDSAFRPEEMHYASLFFCTRAANRAVHLYLRRGTISELLPRHRRLRRLRFAAFAPSFPKAVRVFFGKCATVRLLFAARAAFLTFRRAA